MLFKEMLRMALASLGAQKLRSFLTMAGITIGVFSVIGVMTAVSALRESIETGLSFLGASTVQFSKMPSIQRGGNGYDSAKYAKRRNITLQQAQRYVRLMQPVTDDIALKIMMQGSQAVYGGRKTTPDINYVGTNEHFLSSNQYTIETGRNFTEADIDLASPVTIIGQDLVSKLFPAESPIGKVIKVKSHAYTVIGTFASRGTTFGQSQDAIAVIPITRFLNDNGAEGRTINIATGAPSQASYMEIVDKGITAMRITRGLKAGEENDFEIFSNDSLLEAFAKVADAVSSGAFVISTIALLAAGVGIMNIMLVSVTERTKEIGIRKSIGARKINILSQFLIESVAISLVGGLAGILLGIIAGDGLAMLLKAQIIFPWGWSIAGLVVCSVIGVGFGFYPALKAANLDPIEALRYE